MVVSGFYHSTTPCHLRSYRRGQLFRPHPWATCFTQGGPLRAFHVLSSTGVFLASIWWNRRKPFFFQDYTAILCEAELVCHPMSKQQMAASLLRATDKLNLFCHSPKPSQAPWVCNLSFHPPFRCPNRKLLFFPHRAVSPQQPQPLCKFCLL